MGLRCLAAASFFLVLASGSARAQADDDLLAPLSPVQKSRPKKKPKVRARPVKPAPSDDLLAPLAPAGSGELQVTASPSLKGARLFVDEKELGPAGAGPFAVAPGEHLMSVRRPGFADFSKRITILAGKSTEVTATLEPVLGIVSVSADVLGAQVLIDGQLVGTTPASELLVSPGPHELVVKKEGFVQDAQRFVARAGREQTLSARLASANSKVGARDRPERAQLEPESSGPGNPWVPTEEVVVRNEPLYKRWYVWAGAVAVVTGAVVGVVAANARPGADPDCQPPPALACGGAECDYLMNYPAKCPR